MIDAGLPLQDVRAVLDSPAHRVLSGTLLVMAYRGLRSGRAFRIPLRYAEADDRNEAVHRLFERLGFRCEARLVEADWFKGEWTTLRTYAALRREWATSGSPTGATRAPR